MAYFFIFELCLIYWIILLVCMVIKYEKALPSVSYANKSIMLDASYFIEYFCIYCKLKKNINLNMYCNMKNLRHFYL